MLYWYNQGNHTCPVCPNVHQVTYMIIGTSTENISHVCSVKAHKVWGKISNVIKMQKFYNALTWHSCLHLSSVGLTESSIKILFSFQSATCQKIGSYVVEKWINWCKWCNFGLRANYTCTYWPMFSYCYNPMLWSMHWKHCTITIECWSQVMECKNQVTTVTVCRAGYYAIQGGKSCWVYTHRCVHEHSMTKNQDKSL